MGDKQKMKYYWQTVTVPDVERITGIRMKNVGDWHLIPDLSVFEGETVGLFRIKKFVPNHVETVRSDGTVVTVHYFIASTNGNTPSMYRVTDVLNGHVTGCGRGKGGQEILNSILRKDEPEEPKEQLELKEEEEPKKAPRASDELINFRSNIINSAYSDELTGVKAFTFFLTDKEAETFENTANFYHLETANLLRAIVRTFINKEDN